MRHVLVAALLAVSCAKHDVDVELPKTGRSLTRGERAEMQRVADDAFRDVHAKLDGLPPRLTLIVRWGKDVIPETGENGTASYPGNVMWTLDPDRDALATIRAQLRPTLFHELHHLARASRITTTTPTTTTTLVDRAVTEGLASAFERDEAHVDPPWAKAPDDASWERDVLSQPDDATTTRISMRVGTAWVDRASRATGKTPASLVFASTDEILRAAKVR